MKNLKYLFLTVAAAFCMTSCDWFALDNMEGYDAVIHGSFIDAETGELVLSEISSSTGNFKVIEQGWTEEGAQQTWYVKNNGTYRNNLVFSGDYLMRTSDANYYPVSTNFQLKKGDNEVDFYVTPYVRIVSHDIKFNAADSTIVAKVKVKVADKVKTPTLKDVRLCCYSDNFVGSVLNNCKKDAGAFKENVELDADGIAEVELKIDATKKGANASVFQYDRIHYVRVAALAIGDGVNTSARYNFSPTYSLSLKADETEHKPVLYNEW